MSDQDQAARDPADQSNERGDAASATAYQSVPIAYYPQSDEGISIEDVVRGLWSLRWALVLGALVGGGIGAAIGFQGQANYRYATTIQVGSVGDNLIEPIPSVVTRVNDGLLPQAIIEAYGGLASRSAPDISARSADDESNLIVVESRAPLQDRKLMLEILDQMQQRVLALHNERIKTRESLITAQLNNTKALLERVSKEQKIAEQVRDDALASLTEEKAARKVSYQLVVKSLADARKRNQRMVAEYQAQIQNREAELKRITAYLGRSLSGEPLPDDEGGTDVEAATEEVKDLLGASRVQLHLSLRDDVRSRLVELRRKREQLVIDQAKALDADERKAEVEWAEAQRSLADRRKALVVDHERALLAFANRVNDLNLRIANLEAELAAVDRSEVIAQPAVSLEPVAGRGALLKALAGAMAGACFLAGGLWVARVVRPNK